MDEDKWTAQSRAARATYLLMIRERMTTAELTEILGFRSHAGIYPLMDNISAAGVPVYQPDVGFWALNRERLGHFPDTILDKRPSILD